MSTISEKIELAVEGVLSFFVRFARTTWTIFRHPLTGIQRVAMADPASRTYVLPLSYLAIGGFAFALVMSAYPFGFLNILDLIWFDDEISQIVYTRFREAFTVTGLLLGALPVFLSVTFCVSLAKRLLCRPAEEHTFKCLNYYAFGYQTFTLFLPMVVILFLEIAFFAINGPKVEPQIDPYFSNVLTTILISFLVMFAVSALLLPALSLSYWRYEFLRAEFNSANVVRLIPVPFYAFGVFVLVSYAASIPALMTERFANEPPELEVEIIGDPAFEATELANGSVEAYAGFNIVLYNNPKKALVVEATDFSIFLAKEKDDVEPKFWYTGDEKVKNNGSVSEIFVVQADQAMVLNVSGSMSLPIDVVNFIKDKAADKEIGDDYQLYLGVRYARAGTVFRRSLWFDVDSAAAALP